jgi:hypothetical protein
MQPRAVAYHHLTELRYARIAELIGTNQRPRSVAVDRIARLRRSYLAAALDGPHSGSSTAHPVADSDLDEVRSRLTAAAHARGERDVAYAPSTPRSVTCCWPPRRHGICQPV